VCIDGLDNDCNCAVDDGCGGGGTFTTSNLNPGYQQIQLPTSGSVNPIAGGSTGDDLTCESGTTSFTPASGNRLVVWVQTGSTQLIVDSLTPPPAPTVGCSLTLACPNWNMLVTDNQNVVQNGVVSGPVVVGNQYTYTVTSPPCARYTWFFDFP
jgi:hypothetical protein